METNKNYYDKDFFLGALFSFTFCILMWAACWIFA